MSTLHAIDERDLDPDPLRQFGLWFDEARDAGIEAPGRWYRGSRVDGACDVDTRRCLDNIFGSTPCRSLRYCESCKQPFEQFKTI